MGAVVGSAKRATRAGAHSNRIINAEIRQPSDRGTRSQLLRGLHPEFSFA